MDEPKLPECGCGHPLIVVGEDADYVIIRHPDDHPADCCQITPEQPIGRRKSA